MLAMYKYLIVPILISLYLTVSSLASFQYKAEITTTPDMHKEVSQTMKLSLTDLEKAEYDITKFAVEIKIVNPDEALHYLLTQRLEKKDFLNDYKKSEILKKLLFDFLKAEAEGVFYRDIKHILDDKHTDLMGKEQYEKSRAGNTNLVTGWFEITDQILKIIKLRVGLPKPVNYQGKEMLLFESNLIINKQIPELYTKLKELKEKHGIK